MIIVIGKILLKENKELDFISAAKDLVSASKNYEKCISYDFVKSLVNDEMLFIEKWEDIDGLNEFINSSVFKSCFNSTKDCIDDIDITVYDSEEVNLME